MNTVTIALLLSMCFCALCGATPVISSFDQVVLIPSNCTNEVATKLQRISRETNSPSFLQGFGSELLSIPTNLVSSIIHFILSILCNIRSTFLLWIESIETFLGNPLSLFNNNQNSNQRRRRSNGSIGLSDLISDLPNLLNLPVSYFQQATSSIGDSVGGQIGNVIKTIAKLIWNFIVIQVLPWVRNILDALRRTDVLPTFMNEAINNADSLYSFLRLFADMTSKSS